MDNAASMTPLPFASYPQQGRELLGRPRKPGEGRRGWALDIQRRTGQSACAYCQMSLIDTYEHWLLLVVAHVVPGRAAPTLGLPALWTEDCINLVLACGGCNGFDNRYVPASDVPATNWTLTAFLELRDRVFRERYARIAARRAIERALFDSRPWETVP